MDLKARIRDVPNFPKPGIIFKDITPLLQDREAFQYVIKTLEITFKDKGIDVVAAIDARGFIFGAPLAYELNAAFVPVRKSGKLPPQTVKAEYALEYGTAAVEIRADGVMEGKRVLIVDDLLATGGTMKAAVELVEKLGGKIAGIAVVVELDFLEGRKQLRGHPIVSLVHY